MITKEFINFSVREYFFLHLSPPDQPEPRDSLYADIRGITNEIFEWFKLLPSFVSKSEYKHLIFDILKKAEKKASNDKFFKLSTYHVSLALQDIFSTFQKIE